MLLFKVLFAVVALTVGLIVFNNIYGDNFLFSAFKSRITATPEKSFSAEKDTYEENCLPQKYIGNKYFEIKIPTGFCGCLDDGKSALSQSKALGEKIDKEAFVSMCVDVYYKVSLFAQCKKINNKLFKSKKASRLDCSCFASRVNSLLSRVIAEDFSMEVQEEIAENFMDSDDINAGLARIKQDMTLDVDGMPNIKRPIYSIPQGVVTSCMKKMNKKKK